MDKRDSHAKKPDTLDCTVVRDWKGRPIAGSTALGKGRRVKHHTLSFSRLASLRFDDSPHGLERASGVMDELERLALGESKTKSNGQPGIPVPPSVQLNAILSLIRLLNGKSAFSHDGRSDKGGANPDNLMPGGRTYAPPEKVREQVAALAEELGVERDKLPAYLEAALEARNLRQMATESGEEDDH